MPGVSAQERAWAAKAGAGHWQPYFAKKWLYSVMVSTLDFESKNSGSTPGRTPNKTTVAQLVERSQTGLSAASTVATRSDDNSSSIFNPLVEESSHSRGCLKTFFHEMYSGSTLRLYCEHAYESCNVRQYCGNHLFERHTKQHSHIRCAARERDHIQKQDPS